jgi:oxygen-independent coproporphyrinogen-3 oxidase
VDAVQPLLINPDSPPWITPLALYLHIPFCAHKCGYCDFASVAGQDDLADSYLTALNLEIQRALTFQPSLQTIFVGGGTPTRLSAPQLRRFCEMVHERFQLADGYEWTVEANPGTLDEEKVQILRDSGVNRVSLGAQSFNRSALAALERNHNPADVFRSLDILQKADLPWSLDLIFAAPGTDLTVWEQDLETVLKLQPNHLSCYGLIYEKGTALWKQLQKDLVTPVDDEVEACMFEQTMDRLTAFGLAHYEISNYARPGMECRHNLIYWANDAYFGFGLGAASYVNGIRSSNIRDLTAYIKRIQDGLSVTGPSEQLEPEARARETATLMIRRINQGISRSDFYARTGFSLDDLAGHAMEKHLRDGRLLDDGESVRLSRSGIMQGDWVASDFLA